MQECFLIQIIMLNWKRGYNPNCFYFQKPKMNSNNVLTKSWSNSTVTMQLTSSSPLWSQNIINSIWTNLRRSMSHSCPSNNSFNFESENNQYFNHIQMANKFEIQLQHSKKFISMVSMTIQKMFLIWKNSSENFGLWALCSSLGRTRITQEWPTTLCALLVCFHPSENTIRIKQLFHWLHSSAGSKTKTNSYHDRSHSPNRFTNDSIREHDILFTQWQPISSMMLGHITHKDHIIIKSTFKRCLVGFLLKPTGDWSGSALQD